MSKSQNKLILTVPPHHFCYNINTVLIQAMTLTPTIFYICSYCAHMHALSPSFFLCKWKEGELIHILGCYPWEPKSIPLHSMLRWTPGLRGRDRHVYGCQWLTVRPHWIICLHSKWPPQLALLEVLDWVENFYYFSSSSNPPKGQYFKQEKTWDDEICREHWSGWRKGKPCWEVS